MDPKPKFDVFDRSSFPNQAPVVASPGARATPGDGAPRKVDEAIVRIALVELSEARLMDVFDSLHNTCMTLGEAQSLIDRAKAELAARAALDDQSNTA